MQDEGQGQDQNPSGVEASDLELRKRERVGRLLGVDVSFIPGALRCPEYLLDAIHLE
jgi:hypothetical protein